MQFCIYYFFVISEIARRSKNIKYSHRFGQVKSKIYILEQTDTFRPYMKPSFEMSIYVSFLKPLNTCRREVYAHLPSDLRQYERETRDENQRLVHVPSSNAHCPCASLSVDKKLSLTYASIITDRQCEG